MAEDEELERQEKYNTMSAEIKSVYKELREDLENKESKGRKYKALIHLFSQLVNEIPVLPVRPVDRDITEQDHPFVRRGFAVKADNPAGWSFELDGDGAGGLAGHGDGAGFGADFGGSPSKEAKKASEPNVTKVKKNIKKDGRKHETKKNVSKK